MTSKTYQVSTVRQQGDAPVKIETVGTYVDLAKAISAAKRAAKTRKDSQTYGPTSICYVGREMTAVVAW